MINDKYLCDFELLKEIDLWYRRLKKFFSLTFKHDHDEFRDSYYNLLLFAMLYKPGSQITQIYLNNDNTVQTRLDEQAQNFKIM